MTLNNTMVMEQHMYRTSLSAWWCHGDQQRVIWI